MKAIGALVRKGQYELLPWGSSFALFKRGELQEVWEGLTQKQAIEFFNRTI